jgi:cytochrome d ubiquinol oxidase subunit I
LSYQLGTNWSRWSDITGNVLGPLIQYEVLTAFFLEAAFLGILLFGRSRVPKGVHFAAACAVSLGTLISSFWILSANSWMHTPAGFEIRDGRFFATDWLAIVFNPSFPYRLSHMVTATFLTTAFVVSGVSAWYLLKGRFGEHAKIGLSMGLGLITLLAPLQVLLGDLHGLNTLEHQPAKIAAMEGHWEGGPYAPQILFALPDEEAEANRMEIAIPGLSSLILTHDWQGAVPGLKHFPKDERPPLAIFYTFRLMVGMGGIMLLVALLHVWLRWRGRLFETRWFLKLCVACVPIGFVAILAGWYTTEMGRQPWIVYGLLRTADGVTPSLTGGAAAFSLAAFLIAYLLIFTAGTIYLWRLIQEGPRAVLDAPNDRAGQGMRPMSKGG